MAQLSPASAHGVATASRVRTARITGLWYLGLAITGLCGFLLIRSHLYAAHDPQQTLAQLREQVWLARAGIAFELGVVITQALTAVWFFRLFRSVDVVAAGALAAFGLVNATAILMSATMIAGAFEVALDPGRVAGIDPAGVAQLFYIVSGQLWSIGAVFFGLWLVPMGTLVLRSGWMPRLLGWVLVAGGVGYVLSAFMGLVPGLSTAAMVVTLPASIGEFWMIGYLLVRGTRGTGD
jgi:hypothetical protein